MALRALVAGLIFASSLSTFAQPVVPELRQPAWAELTQEQKQILAPLARDWDKLEAVRKKKWIGIAKRYPTMNPEEQARVQRRIKDWSSLTPEERTQARAQYKNLKTAPPERKEAIKEKWEQYKELPDDEKKRLAEKAASKPSPKLGIASSPKPVPKIQTIKLQPLPLAATPAPPPAATAKESPAITETAASPEVTAQSDTPPSAVVPSSQQ